MKIENNEIDKIFDIIFKEIRDNNFIKAFISNPLSSKDSISKINIKPVLLKDELFYQMEYFENNKAYHKNLKLEEIIDKFQEFINKYKQILFVTMGNTYQILKNKKNYNIRSSPNGKENPEFSHNNNKNYILRDGIPVLFLEKLKIMDRSGNVHKSKYDKFRQINKYLEFIDNTIRELCDKKLIGRTIKCVDFGCGKSYLTFALYHYLKNIEKFDFEIIGLDLKEDVIDTCNKIARELEYNNLEFLQGDIKDFEKLKDADIVFSLHACDTATDYAILKSLQLNAKAILAVPCCQHEFSENISKNKNSNFFQTENIIGKHGILLEKYSTLATDAFRAQALQLCGYKVQVMEFIDMEHTPKNVIIKGIKSKMNKKDLLILEKEYNNFKDFLGFNPLLDTLLQEYFMGNKSN